MFCLWRVTASIVPRHMFSHSVVQKSRRLWYSTQDSNGRFSPHIRLYPADTRPSSWACRQKNRQISRMQRPPLPLRPMTMPQKRMVPFHTLRLRRPAILRFGHGLSQSASRRPPITPQSTFSVQVRPPAHSSQGNRANRGQTARNLPSNDVTGGVSNLTPNGVLPVRPLGHVRRRPRLPESPKNAQNGHF